MSVTNGFLHKGDGSVQVIYYMLQVVSNNWQCIVGGYFLKENFFLDPLLLEWKGNIRYFVTKLVITHSPRHNSGPVTSLRLLGQEFPQVSGCMLYRSKAVQVRTFEGFLSPSFYWILMWLLAMDATCSVDFSVSIRDLILVNVASHTV